MKNKNLLKISIILFILACIICLIFIIYKGLIVKEGNILIWILLLISNLILIRSNIINYKNNY